MSLRFAVAATALALVLLAFRWHSAEQQLGALQGVLGAGAQALARQAARQIDDRTDAPGHQALLDQWCRDDPRLLTVQLLGPDSAATLAARPVGVAAPTGLPAPDAAAGLRGVAGGWLGLPAYYVLDHPLPGPRMLRLVYDGAPLAQAWWSMVWPALVVLALMAVLVVALFHWLLARPLGSLRELTAFAKALPESAGARLAEHDSHLVEIDAARKAFNLAAELVESRRRELAEQRALLRAVIDAMPSGLTLKSLDGTLVLMNAYMAARLGRTPTELEGRSVVDVGRPDYTQRMRELDARLLAGGGRSVVVDTEGDLLLDDRTPHLVTKTLVRLQGREQPLVLTITTNVDELRRSQRAADHAQRLLRAVFDADETQMMVKDEAGRFVMVNSGLLRYWRLEESQVLGRDSRTVFGDAPSLRASLELDRRVWAGEGPLVTEQAVAGPDGESQLMVTRRLVNVSDGRTLLLVVARDISALRRQAREIEHHERLVREVIDLEDHYILVKDAQQRYVLVNDAYARATRRRKDELIGRTPREAFGDHPAIAAIGAIEARVIEERVTVVREERIDLGLGDGERVLLADRRPIMLADGSIGVLAVIRDVSDERQREASLRSAMQRAQAAVEARSRFLANISHEVRTPINGMMGLTDLVLASALTPQQREWLTLARAAAQGLLEIVNDVLDLSKIDAGAMGIERTAFDLHALLVEACRPMALRARAKALGFTLVIAPELPELVRGDPTRLRQVLGNLVGNAVKFTQAGSVTVRAGVQGGDDDAPPRRISIAIEDTGPGIAPDKHEQVFEPFVQADESTTRRFGGTGLGLAICRQLVALMDGRIVLDSSLGRGSRFTVDLPLEAAPRSVPMPALQGRRLAWIEAEGGSFEIWRPWLVLWGIEAVVARHPAQALGQRELPIDTLVFEGVTHPTPYDAAVREWRGRGELRRLIVLHAVGAVDAMIERPAGTLPSARGLPVARLTRPLAPRELHDALSRRIEGRFDPGTVASHALRRLDGRHVLLAEDNDVNLLLAQTMLAQLGAEVTSVRDGAQALDRLLNARYDVVLMDIQMPELDGTDVVRQWRRIETEGQAPPAVIVALTAHAMSGDRERFIAAGFDGYLGKPFTIQALLEAIEAAIARPLAARGTE
ncbi:MAG TPA: ATP-binding protein [Burkholderiaceae bacterium]|nr:ATP-binding protein [Burkholderiaceae bacterium]